MKCFFRNHSLHCFKNHTIHCSPCPETIPYTLSETIPYIIHGFRNHTLHCFKNHSLHCFKNHSLHLSKTIPYSVSENITCLCDFLGFLGEGLGNFFGGGLSNCLPSMTSAYHCVRVVQYKFTIQNISPYKIEDNWTCRITM